MTSNLLFYTYINSSPFSNHSYKSSSFFFTTKNPPLIKQSNMIFCLYESKLCVATIVFYTCIYIPLLKIKQVLSSILRFILFPDPHRVECSDLSMGVDPWDSCSADLPVSQYGDLKVDSQNDDVVVDGDSDCEEACSVCLVEFESEDLVSQLSKCGHVFHMACIEKWVDKNQFTCPLCRSSFLNMHGSASHATCNTMLSCFSS